MTKQLPTRPDIDVLKREAKTLLKSDPTLNNLAEAQHQLAQTYGFDKWADLKHRVEEVNLARLNPLTWLKSADTPKPKPAHPNPNKDWWLALANADDKLIANYLAKDPTLANTPGGPLDRYPLHYLCCLSVVPIDFLASLKLLLAQNPDPNVRFEHHAYKGSSLSPLWGTIQYKQSREGSRLLLKAGANPNDNESVYHGVEVDDPELIKLLIAHGATEDKTNGVARALDFNRIPQVQILLEAGADPNDTTTGETRLHHGIRRGRGRPFIELLVKHGADLTAKSREGLNAPEHAAYRLTFEDFEWLKTLTGLPVSKEAELVAEIRSGKPTQARFDPSLSRATRALLAHAAYFGEINLCRHLLELGWPVDEPDNANASGSSTATPLECAAFAGHADIVQLLVDHNANLNHYDPHYKGTPFTYACYGSEANLHGDQLACLRILLEAGGPIPETPYTASDEARDLIAELRG